MENINLHYHYYYYMADRHNLKNFVSALKEPSKFVREFEKLLHQIIVNFLEKNYSVGKDMVTVDITQVISG